MILDSLSPFIFLLHSMFLPVQAMSSYEGIYYETGLTSEEAENIVIEYNGEELSVETAGQEEKTEKEKQDVKISEYPIQKLESLALNLVNDKRQSAGLAPVKLDEKLIELAKIYSQKMADYNTASHYLENTNPRQRAIDFGILLSDDFVANNQTENIAWGRFGCIEGCSFTPESELRSRIEEFVGEKSWNGPHYRTIYHQDFNAVGVGAVWKGDKFYITWEYAKLDNINSGTEFSDIKSDDIYYAAIKYLFDQHIISGFDDGLIRPEREITRAELLKIAYKAFDLSVEQGNSNFSDVSDDDWFKKYVDDGVNRGVLKGYEDGTFRPNQTVSRAEALKILSSLSDIQFDSDTYVNFSDITESDWYSVYASFIASEKKMDFYSDKFYPDKKMTRGEIFDLIYRLKK